LWFPPFAVGASANQSRQRNVADSRGTSLTPALAPRAGNSVWTESRMLCSGRAALPLVALALEGSRDVRLDGHDDPASVPEGCRLRTDYIGLRHCGSRHSGLAPAPISHASGTSPTVVERQCGQRWRAAPATRSGPSRGCCAAVVPRYHRLHLRWRSRATCGSMVMRIPTVSLTAAVSERTTADSAIVVPAIGVGASAIADARGASLTLGERWLRQRSVADDRRTLARPADASHELNATRRTCRAGIGGDPVLPAHSAGSFLITRP
jgi:hypothetical protein